MGDGKAEIGSYDEGEEAILEQRSHCVSNTEQILDKAGSIINDLLHKEVKKLSDQKLTNNRTLFNISSMISRTDPQLWHFLKLHVATSGTHEHNPTTDHGKQNRQYYILCLLMYCTNLNKPTPLHILLADAVEIHGESRLHVNKIIRYRIIYRHA